MGASLCMDLKQKQLCREVRGVARRTQTVLDAFFAEAVDLATMTRTPVCWALTS